MHKVGLSNQFCPSVSLSVQKPLKNTLSMLANALTGFVLNTNNEHVIRTFFLPGATQGGCLFSATSYKYYQFISPPLSNSHMLVAMQSFLIDTWLYHAPRHERMGWE